jgi:restriction system protein
MARRKKSSLLNDLIDLVALLPWWAGVLLAIICYAALHHVATQTVDIPAPLRPGQTAAAVSRSVWRVLAGVGQYVLAAVCLIGAVLSAWRRRERQKLLTEATKNDAASVADAMTWQEFEILVGEGFRQQGFQVSETGGSRPDGGVDLVLKKSGASGEKFLVQCKHWRAHRVGVDVVRQLYGVMAAQGAAGGFVVTSGGFTPDAISFAQGRNLVLMDGPKLGEFLKQAKAHVSHPQQRQAAAPLANPTPALAVSPSCPLCAKRMVLRTAKQGAHVGSQFWGCTAFPACRGSRPMATAGTAGPSASPS